MDKFNHSRKTFLTTHWLLTNVFNGGKGTDSFPEIQCVIGLIHQQGNGTCHSSRTWRKTQAKIETKLEDLKKPRRIREVLALRLCGWFTKYMAQECEQKGYGMRPRWSSSDPLPEDED